MNRIVLAAFALFLLAACGTRGPLFLPPPDAVKPRPASAPADDSKAPNTVTPK